MKISEVCRIFDHIDSTEYTDEQKGMAIYQVTKMFTHNSITKASMLKVIEYLLNLSFELPEEDKNAET